MRKLWRNVGNVSRKILGMKEALKISTGLFGKLLKILEKHPIIFWIKFELTLKIIQIKILKTINCKRGITNRLRRMAFTWICLTAGCHVMKLVHHEKHYWKCSLSFPATALPLNTSVLSAAICLHEPSLVYACLQTASTLSPATPINRSFKSVAVHFHNTFHLVR